MHTLGLNLKTHFHSKIHCFYILECLIKHVTQSVSQIRVKNTCGHHFGLTCTNYAMAVMQKTMVARGQLVFYKRLGSIVISPKPSQNGLYPLLCAANVTSLTPLYVGFFFLYGRQWDYYIFP